MKDRPRHHPAVVSGLAALLAVCALPLTAQSPFGERVDVNIVNVEVYVTDAAGQPVSGLERRDFAVREDGKAMDIVNFAAVSRPPGRAATVPPAPPAPPAAIAGGGAAAAPPPPPPPPPPDAALWVIYVDNANLRPAHRARALGQIRDFLTGQLAPGDQVMLVSYDLGVHVRLPFTDDRAALARELAAMERLAGNTGELDRERQHAVEQILKIQELAAAGPKGRAAGEDTVRDECPQEIVGPARVYADQVRNEVLSSIKALTVLVNSLSGLPGRKALLHVSDGLSATPGEEVFEVLNVMCGTGAATAGIRGVGVFDNSGGNNTSYQGNQAALDAQAYSTVKQWTALAAHANAQRVTLYMLQAGGLEAPGGAAQGLQGEDRLLALPAVAMIEAENRKQPLTLLASETGGRAIFNANDIRPELARIEQELGTYYSLAYSPPHTGDGRDHRIEVRVKRAGLRVRHRLGYRDKPALERAVDRTLAGLFYGVEDNPLDVAMEIGGMTPGTGGAFTVPVHLRIPLFRLHMIDHDGVIEGRLRLLVATRGAAGANAPVRQVEVPIRFPRDQALIALGQAYQYDVTLTLAPGEQHVAIAVRDEGTTTTSYLARTVKVGGARPAVTGKP